MEIPERNVIFLKGVFFNDIQTLEECINNELANAESDEYCCAPTIDSVRVTKFLNKKQWSNAYKDSTIKCWYCGLNFRGMPCFIPYQIRNTPRGKEYDAHGLFCGFACAFTFLRNNAEFIRDKSYCDKLMMLKMLFVIFYNKKAMEFIEAPSVYNMTIYGGYIDVMDYRSQLKTINMNMINNGQIIKK